VLLARSRRLSRTAAHTDGGRRRGCERICVQAGVACMQSSGGKAGAETVRAALAAALSAQPMTPAVARTLETQPGAVLQVSVLYSDRAVE